MYTYSIIQWLFFFYFYCFVGWCIETTYVSLHQKRLVNRGFMRGPFLPLYGSGAVMMLLVSMPFREHLVLSPRLPPSLLWKITGGRLCGGL